MEMTDFVNGCYITVPPCAKYRTRDYRAEALV